MNIKDIETLRAEMKNEITEQTKTLLAVFIAAGEALTPEERQRAIEAVRVMGADMKTGFDELADKLQRAFVALDATK